MATLMPSRIATIAQEPLNGERLVEALRPWRRRLGMQQFVRWTSGGLITGLALACLVLLVSRFIPWASAPRWALGIAIASTLLTMAAAIWYRPSLPSSARIIDERLALHNRLGTAWELREDSSVLARLQRRDALKQLQKHTPSVAISLRVHRVTLLAFLLVVIALALLLLLPNPMNAVLQQQAAFQAHIAQQIASIENARRQLAQQQGIPKSQQQQIDKVLQQLEEQLSKATNDTDAQQALAQAQAQLDQLRDPQASSRAQATTDASSSLQNSTNSNLSAAGKALAQNNSQALADALKKLEQQIAKMTPAQRNQLAQQLEQAANQAGQDSKLSSALHQLAQSIADNNQSAMASAINALQSATSQNAASQAQENALNQTSQNLQQVANSLASSTDTSPNQGQQSAQGQGQQGQQGQQTGQGQQGQQGQAGQGQQSAQGQGQQGQQGNGQGQGQGKGQNQGQGQGQGQGSAGGSNGAGNHQGQNDQVFVPGELGSGTSTQSQDNTSSISQDGNDVPYSQVIEEYSQMAHDAIDNSNVPPDTKDLVHNYFDSLEGQGH